MQLKTKYLFVFKTIYLTFLLCTALWWESKSGAGPLVEPSVIGNRKKFYSFGQNREQNSSGVFFSKPCQDSDDEEWYPPSPPIYDVTDKLIEINRIFREDPTPVLREPNKLRWRTGPGLVQVWTSNLL